MRSVGAICQTRNRGRCSSSLVSLQGAPEQYLGQVWQEQLSTPTPERFLALRTTPAWHSTCFEHLPTGTLVGTSEGERHLQEIA